MDELVSIFIPTYNSAAFLHRSISSVLGQTFPDYHLYILDDASTDNTFEVVAPFINHPKLSYVRHPNNLGMTRNWNKGIELSKGVYVAKLDADDFYEPYFLDETLAVLDRNPEVGLVFGGFEWITEKGTRSNSNLWYTEDWIVDGDIFLENLQRQFVALGPTICVRRECYEQLGSFVGGMKIHSDWEMWMRIATRYQIGYISKILASIYRHNESVTAGALTDTRTPDDFALWLKLLDQHQLAYELSTKQRNLLELSMIQKCRDLLYRAIANKSWSTVEGCARFLLQRKQIPPYEQARHLLILFACKRLPSLIPQIMRGNKLTTRLWNLEAQLQIKLPASNPYDAITASS